MRAYCRLQGSLAAGEDALQVVGDDQSGSLFQSGFQACQGCRLVVRVVVAVVDAQVAAERAQQGRSVSAVLEGDEAGSCVHASTGQPVGGFAHKGGFADAAKAMNGDELAAQQVALDLQ